MEEIEVIVNTVGANIVIFSEIWINQEEETYFNFKNFGAVYSSRPTRGGGIGIFVKNNIDFEITKKIVGTLILKLS